MIGQGSYGRVIMGLDVEAGYMMAVKQVQIGVVNTSAQQDVSVFSFFPPSEINATARTNV